MSDHRDPSIRSALDDVDVPEYERGFWDRLDARLAEERPGDRGGSGPTGHDPHGVQDHPAGIHELTGPALVPLAARARVPRRRVLLAAAAVAAVVALATAVQLRPGQDELQTASPPGGTEVDGTPGPEAPRPATAGEVAVAWLDSIGAGDVDAVLDRTGPRTVAYFEALGADLPGVVTEWGEVYGAWADVPDRSVDVLPVQDPGGLAVVVVVVSGTWQGEGTDGPRSEALAMVRSSNGTWFVEPAAFDPDREGRLEITSPAPTEQGLGSIGPDGVIEVVSAGVGTYHFAIDGTEMARVAAGAKGSLVRFDPTGSLRGGAHRLVIAQVDERNITAQALTFTVEG